MPPYHLRSNGLAERFVCTLKEHLQAAGQTANMQIDKFLLSYHNTPHSTTGEAPAVLLKGHLLHTGMMALSMVGNKLLVKQHQSQGPKWRPAMVVGMEGSRVVDVQLLDGWGTQKWDGCEAEQKLDSANSLWSTDVNADVEPPELEQTETQWEHIRRSQRKVKPPERLVAMMYFRLL